MPNTVVSLQSLRRHVFTASLILICLTAFFTIALLSDRIFEHLPHSEDEAAYLFQAKVFAQNHLAAPTPPLRQAFWSPFVVDYQGQRFGKYPPGWPFLLSLGVRLGEPWLVNATLAAITLALIAWLGHCFCRRAYMNQWHATNDKKSSPRRWGDSPLPEGEGLGVRATTATIPKKV